MHTLTYVTCTIQQKLDDRCAYMFLIKVRKAAKIRNRYNQVPHLTQDTTWERDKNTNITNKSQEVSNKTVRNRRKSTTKKQMIHKRSNTLERPAKYFTGGLKRGSGWEGGGSGIHYSLKI